MSHHPPSVSSQHSLFAHHSLRLPDGQNARQKWFRSLGWSCRPWYFSFLTSYSISNITWGAVPQCRFTDMTVLIITMLTTRPVLAACFATRACLPNDSDQYHFATCPQWMKTMYLLWLSRLTIVHVICSTGGNISIWVVSVDDHIKSRFMA